MDGINMPEKSIILLILLWLFLGACLADSLISFPISIQHSLQDSYTIDAKEMKTNANRNTELCGTNILKLFLICLFLELFEILLK
jgi:hypothetical protein